MGWVNYIKSKRQNLTSESLSAILEEQKIIFTELKEYKLTLRVVYTAVCSKNKWQIKDILSHHWEEKNLEARNCRSNGDWGPPLNTSVRLSTCQLWLLIWGLVCWHWNHSTWELGDSQGPRPAEAAGVLTYSVSASPWFQPTDMETMLSLSAPGFRVRPQLIEECDYSSCLTERNRVIFVVSWLAYCT